MKRTIAVLALAIATTSGACGKSNNQQADAALNADLTLAAQQQRNQFVLDSMERVTAAKRATQTTRTGTSGGTVARQSSGTSTSSSSNGGEVVVKHTQRDAAIGAAAGAIIGATTSKNKVQGGVIGAAVGGILGGVIGNNVDKTKKKKP